MFHSVQRSKLTSCYLCHGQQVNRSLSWNFCSHPITLSSLFPPAWLCASVLIEAPQAMWFEALGSQQSHAYWLLPHTPAPFHWSAPWTKWTLLSSQAAIMFATLHTDPWLCARKDEPMVTRHTGVRKVTTHAEPVPCAQYGLEAFSLYQYFPFCVNNFEGHVEIISCNCCNTDICRHSLLIFRFI